MDLLRTIHDSETGGGRGKNVGEKVRSRLRDVPKGCEQICPIRVVIHGSNPKGPCLDLRDRMAKEKEVLRNEAQKCQTK